MTTVNGSTNTVNHYGKQEKAERNAAFLQKLDRGLNQIRAGCGIVKSFKELRAMEENDC